MTRINVGDEIIAVDNTKTTVSGKVNDIIEGDLVQILYLAGGAVSLSTMYWDVTVTKPAKVGPPEGSLIMGTDISGDTVLGLVHRNGIMAIYRNDAGSWAALGSIYLSDLKEYRVISTVEEF